MRTFSLIFTAIGVALCLLHYAGLDPKHLLLFSFSVPLWFLPAVTDFRTIPLAVVYLLTVASWTVMGYVIDRFVYRRKHTAS